MLKKITLLGLSMFAMCLQLALSQVNADFTINQGNNICVNECITITDNSTSVVNITNWNWSITSTSTTIPTIPNPAGQDPGTICFSAVGTYNIELTVEDANGDIANANIQLAVVSCPGSLSAGFISKSTVCSGECITLRDTSSGEPAFWTWLITPVTAVVYTNGTTNNSQNPEVCFLPAAVASSPLDIELTVENADKSKISKFTKQINVVENPTVVAAEDTIVELGNPAILSAVATGASQYQWEPNQTVTNPKNLTTFAYPIETTDYVIRVVDGNGCFAEDTMRVFLNFLPTIGVPTAFSPNGDGKNDLLVVEGLALDKCIFKVYNRYGIQVFESTVQKNGWDGNYKGKPESPGVFHWTLEYEFNTEKRGTLSGNTTLVR